MCYRPLRGLGVCCASPPGAYAPGFTPASALRTQARSLIRQVCDYRFNGFQLRANSLRRKLTTSSHPNLVLSLGRFEQYIPYHRDEIRPQFGKPLKRFPALSRTRDPELKLGENEMEFGLFDRQAAVASWNLALALMIS
jgi:hypothetical protein